MSRILSSFIAAYFILGVVTTAVTEVVSLMQGSSRVIGAFTGGAAPEAIAIAVVQYWLVPIFTWPYQVVIWAVRELSA